MFEIKNKDGMGRIGSLTINKKKLETPLLLPVINPQKQTVSVDAMKKIGFNAVITNSYLIYKDEKTRNLAQTDGVHGLLKYDGVIFTDSGSYQLMKYAKEIDVDTVTFQKEIQSDVINIIDIPTLPNAQYSKANSDLKETLQRAISARKNIKDTTLSVGLQGGSHKNLRKKAAYETSKIADIVAVGGIVPLMEQYRFSTLTNILAWSSLYSDVAKPKHAFGLGHPLLIPLAVSLGYDIFDSASYALFAREGRYLTENKTHKLDEMQYLPCVCPICQKNTVDTLKNNECDLAQHNLYVIQQTIKKTKEAICENRLSELVQQTAMSHPNFENLRALRPFSKKMYRYGPLYKKSALFFNSRLSEFRPEIRLFLDRLIQRFVPKKTKRVVIIGDTQKPYSVNAYSIIKRIMHQDTSYAIFSYPFGIVPYELWDIYPIPHTTVPEIDDNVFNLSLNNASQFLNNFKEFYDEIVTTKIDAKNDLKLIEALDLPCTKTMETDGTSIDTQDEQKFEAIFRYQFGFSPKIENLRIEKSKYNKIRNVYSNDELFFVIRATDGFISLQKKGAEFLHKNKSKYNVKIAEDAIKFAKEGKTIFSKFVTPRNKNILSKDEVIVTDETNRLIAYGKTMLSSKEMNSFSKGAAIKNRL